MIARDIAPHLFPPPEEVDRDFALHYPMDYVHRVVTFLRLSNWCFWPNAGGLNDQDSFLIEDILTWIGIEARLKTELRESQALEDSPWVVRKDDLWN